MVKEQQLLLPAEEYLKSGIHIGTKFKTKHMEPFIYKIRPDGLSVLNLKKIDERIRIGAKLLSQYNPDQILVVCRRENGWKAIEKMHELTGIKVYPGRYPPGILTNPNLKNFTEAKIVLVTDPWPDRNVIRDAKKVGIPVIALCDTNNTFNNIDFVIPCNNKGRKSLALIYYLLTKLYLMNRGLPEREFKAKVEDFLSE